MSYTRLNPLKDSFSYSGTATATTSISTLKNVGAITGTWVICAVVWPTQAVTTALQCRLYGSSSGLWLNKNSVEKSVTNVITAIMQDESIELDTYSPTTTTIGWKLKGIRIA